MLVESYRDSRRRITDIAAAVSPVQLQTSVPATPEWTVHELLAHLVGGAADAATGRLDGVTSDQWTQRHVSERRDRPLDVLMSEWEQVGSAAEASLARQRITRPNLAADAICHEADLHEALGLGRVGREHWQPFLEVMMRFARLQFRHSAAFVIQDDEGQQWNCGSGGPATALRADGYELLRAAYSRRSRSQIAAWDWYPAPDVDVVERFGLFGPRDDDQPVPVADSDTGRPAIAGGR
jgi:uncharacterized protein (TIGR03083 family)